MPGIATITAYNTFVAGNKARASEVNTNFTNHRGHLVPINTDTTTASNNTHDLGATDRQWRNIYLQNPPFINGSQSGKLQIQTIYDGSNPTDLVADDNWLTKSAFRYDDTTGVAFQFIVPDEYTAGNRMSLSLRGYCETGTAHFTLESTSALFKHSLTTASTTSPANVLTSTSNIAPPAAANLFFTDTSLRLTGATGLINSLTVTAGDVIAVTLKRTGGATADTNTGYFYLTNIQIDLNN